MRAHEPRDYTALRGFDTASNPSLPENNFALPIDQRLQGVLPANGQTIWDFDSVLCGTTRMDKVAGKIERETQMQK
jgi:hypothetical protein